MTDITNRADIELLMKHFYNKVLADDLIGYLFTQVARLNLETHLPTICDFWETVLLQRESYRKDVMAIHLGLHHQSALKKEHFERWLMLFNESVDGNFAGLRADLAKIRAQSIATAMQVKLTPKDVSKR